MYVRHKQALGIDIQKYIDTAAPALAAVKNVLDDPALPKVTSLVIRLHGAQQAKPTVPGQPTPPKQPGIGLSKIVKPLELYVYSQEHFWVLPAVLGGIIAIPFLLGRYSKK